MRTILLLAALASPLGAQSWSEAPTQLDITVGSGGDVSMVSFGTIRLAAPGGSEHLRFGLGLRAALMAGDLSLTPQARQSMAVSGRDTLRMKVAPITLNVAGHVAYDFGDRFSAGVNLDLFGFTTGGMRSGIYMETPSATPRSVNGQPTATSIFGFGGNDMGSLTQEYYGSWKLNDTYTLRGGLSRQRVEYKTDGDAVASGTNRFAYTANVVFVGMRIQP